MNLEQTIAAVKEIEPVIKSDDGTIIKSNENNIAISELRFNIRALTHWTNISFIICFELSKVKLERAKDYLLQTLDAAAEVICEKMKYVEYHEKAITDSDIDNWISK